ncbi:unnamed protein product, partial [Ectocarpus sp. 8 AP-2014]
WAFFAIVGVLVDNSVVQLGLFCAMHSLTFILLVVFKPFANSVLNAMGAMVMLTDAVCMGMLATSASMFDGTPTANGIDTAVMVTQQLCVAALVVPLYLDTCVSLWGLLRGRRGRVKTRENEDDRAEREFITRRTLRLWAPTWFRMVGNNLF